MSQPDLHPAATLPEAERLEYLRLVASMALVDGRITGAELAKLERLGKTLSLAPHIIAPLIVAVRGGKLDQPAPTDEALWFKGPKAVRFHLMIDSIVLAFTDGKLAGAEGERIARLAQLLDVAREDVVRMARLIEKILWKREADEAVLARELGEAVGAPAEGARLLDSIRLVAGGPAGGGGGSAT